MKLITLNTHSLIEEHYEEKLHAFAEVIRKEKPDILAMQEVNQLACEEIWPDEKLPGFVRCRGFSLPVRRGNHAARLAELLKDSGLSYSWTWISAKMGYDRYDEGMAVFSLSPIDNFPLIIHSISLSSTRSGSLLCCSTSLFKSFIVIRLSDFI